MPEGLSRRPLAIIALIAALALCAPIAASAAGRKPHGITGAATHVLGTSALLTGTVFAEGQETAYYFQWGPTNAYGATTTPAVLPVGTTGKLAVGQPISGLTPGATYHFRIVAGGAPGRDRTFIAKGAKPRFEIPRPAPARIGSTFVLSGVLRGYGAAGKGVALQASAYPYTEGFATLGLPARTDASGRFAFRIANITRNTQFRVITLDALPTFSSTVTVKASVAVSMHVRASSSPGIVRLYGSITPDVAGAKVYLQVEKAVRPGARTEATTHWVTQFVTVAKHTGSGTSSRFSAVVDIRLKGRYRAFVRLPGGARFGAWSSGASTSLLIRTTTPKRH